MRDWINGACDEVDRLTAQQPYYQELLSKRKRLERRYLEIVSSLSEADAEVIAEYEFLTSEMDYQRIQTAFQVGRSSKRFR
ncbi:MAG: hypothetical protein E7451_07150 [Ruminococcaceae bacterium]|nr:hypothetical protein [Oscillospiraceae bacterium]